MKDDNLGPFGWIGVITVVLIACYALKSLIDTRVDERNCVKGKLTVCIGDTEQFGVPTCYDFPLAKYMYEQYSDHLVVVNKEVSSDVVNYPHKKLVSAAKSGCKD